MRVRKILAVLLIALLGMIAVNNSCKLYAGAYDDVPSIVIKLPI